MNILHSESAAETAIKTVEKIFNRPMYMYDFFLSNHRDDAVKQFPAYSGWKRIEYGVQHRGGEPLFKLGHLSLIPDQTKDEFPSFPEEEIAEDNRGMKSMMSLRMRRMRNHMHFITLAGWLAD